MMDALLAIVLGCYAVGEIILLVLVLLLIASGRNS